MPDQEEHLHARSKGTHQHTSTVQQPHLMLRSKKDTNGSSGESSR